MWLWMTLACAGLTDDTPKGADSAADSPTTDSDAPPPEPPEGLERWLTGDPDDAQVTPTGPTLLVAGGGGDVDAAMAAWMAAANGGDVVVLRTSGSDGYNDYLFSELGGVDSVETLLVDRPAWADDPYVVWRVSTAEAVFLAGGDQSTYLGRWSDSLLHDALNAIWARGGALGGTSAGAAVLGQRAFSATAGTITSEQALGDPFHERMRFWDDFLSLPPMQGVVVDTHFAARERMGRSLAFAARTIADGVGDSVLAMGVDEATAALLSADGSGQVYGSGAVYLVQASQPASVCEAGSPLSLEGWSYRAVRAGESLQLPSGQADSAARDIAVNEGVMTPADPY